MHKFGIPLICFFFVKLFYSCSGGNNISKIEPILYQNNFEIHHRLVHYLNDTCILYVFADSDEYELSLTAFSTENSNIILAEKKVSIRNKNKIPTTLKFKVREPKYDLEIIIREENGNRIFRDAFLVDKTVSSSSIEIKNEDGDEVVKPYIDILSELTISHPEEKTLWVKYFEKEFKSAAPPFSSQGYKFNPNKNFAAAIPIPSGGTIKLEGEGLYFIQTDTSFYNGIYINVFENKFPRISSAQQMLESTRYIMKLDEYKTVAASDNVKEAIDKFWLGRAPDKEFAKELIKVFYTRIQIANRDFTTYKEGWKTDRGMLYVIFGEPDEISKRRGNEVWGYRATDKRNGVRFEFKKIHGQTLLKRMEQFKRPWDVEVYEWRKGLLND